MVTGMEDAGNPCYTLPPMALYRKYRPQSFADVVGQDHIVTTLENAAVQDKLAHAFLFAGSRGTGKTSVARILAKILMTKDIADETVQQHIIKGVEEGNLVDLMEIDGASNRGIDDIRDLIEKIQFSPVTAGTKVYIIDEVHMLTKEAFNALLKTLEEPPAYAYFILATTELNKIPATIQSRCQCFPFRQIREEDIIRRLQFIADQERITIDREALRAIAHHVRGGMRDAISMLDQMHSLEKVTLLDVEQRIGGGSREHIEGIFSAIEAQDKNKIVEIVQKVEENGVPVDVFLRELLEIVRKALHQAIIEKEEISLAIHMLDTLLAATRDVRTAPVPGLVLEAALLSLCAEEKSDKKSKSTIFARAKETVEKESPKPKDEVKEKEVPDKEKPVTETEHVAKEDEEKQDEKTEATPVQEASVEAPELTLETLRDSWTDIVKQTAPASIKMSLKNGKIESLDDKKITVSFTSSFHCGKVADIEASRAVEQVIEKIFHRTMRIECIIEKTQPAGSQVADADMVNLAEAAAEIF
jgi:DNA polymerase III subunit gamma/tau